MTRSTESQLASFIGKFEPGVARLIRACRKRMRVLLPAANEIVYDNYNFFVIGYSSTVRPSDCIVAIVAAANGVGLSFYRGADLNDPGGLLQGSGAQNRYIRLPTIAVLSDAEVVSLIEQAIERARTPLPKSGRGALIIRSVATKQRPRRK